jgi:hypothetical protein
MNVKVTDSSNYTVEGNHGVSVGIETRLRAGEPRDRGSNPRKGKRVLFSVTSPE